MTKGDILTLLERKKLTAKQLARKIKSKISTVNTLLARMRLYGLVKRTPISDYKEKGGRYAYLYEITSNGLKRLIWYNKQDKGSKARG